MMTLFAVLGPLFVATMVYVIFCPAVAGSGESVFVRDRFAAALTVVAADAELLAVFGSVAVEDTVTVLLIVPD